MASLTVLREQHPDEWLQSTEFSYYLLFGKMREFAETSVTLRHLFWPSLLTIPIQFADLVLPNYPLSRVFAVKLFVGLLDLFVMLGVLAALQRMQVKNAEKLALLFFFTTAYLVESVRTSLEHGSAIFFWAGYLLALRNDKHSLLGAGLFWALASCIRYPSVFMPLGAMMMLFWQMPQRKNFFFHIGGWILGAILIGLYDWYFYRGFFSSFRAYVDYNLFSGISTEMFGSQPIWEYGKYFNVFGGHGVHSLIVILPILCFGFYEGMRRKRLWACAGLLFLLGHIIPAHKEPRFLAPLLPIFFLAAIQAYIALKERPWSKYLRYGGVIFLVANYLQIPVTLSGELWKPRMEILRLKEDTQRCAVVASFSPPLLWLPKDVKRFGYMQLGSGESIDFEKKIQWFGDGPRCRESEFVEIIVHNPDPFWRELGCRKIFSGYYDKIGESLVELNVRRYQRMICPGPAIAAAFPAEKGKVVPLVQQLGKQ